MTAADVLEIAARQAESQPDATAAIRAALSFAGRYPEALRAAEAEAGPAPGISLALALSIRRYGKGGDVAWFFRRAARRGAAS